MWIFSLTFALYHYLSEVKKYEVTLLGIDLKNEVIQKCQTLSDKLGFKNLQFKVQDINDHEPVKDVDIVVSLHACDTATDAALEKAIRWRSRAIFAVPCCQHELFNQIEDNDLKPLLKHGILKERFAAIVTDACRAELLMFFGYETQVLEFIDLEHTAKNVLIRAVKRNKEKGDHQHYQNYFNLKKRLHINPSFERRFKKELEQDLT